MKRNHLKYQQWIEKKQEKVLMGGVCFGSIK